MFSSQQPLALWAAIFSCVSLTIWLEFRYRWAESIGGPTLGLAIAALLSNLGVMPTEREMAGDQERRGRRPNETEIKSNH
jgi:hypothetical protein